MMKSHLAHALFACTLLFSLEVAVSGRAELAPSRPSLLRNKCCSTTRSKVSTCRMSASYVSHAHMHAGFCSRVCFDEIHSHRNFNPKTAEAQKWRTERKSVETGKRVKERVHIG